MKTASERRANIEAKNVEAVLAEISAKMNETEARGGRTFYFPNAKLTDAAIQHLEELGYKVSVSPTDMREPSEPQATISW